MNKLSTVFLAGAMAMGTYALAADEVGPGPAVKPENCSKLSGKKKDECTQSTPAGPVDMKTGKQEKGKSEIAKDRDRKNKQPGQSNDSAREIKQPITTGEPSARKQ